MCVWGGGWEGGTSIIIHTHKQTIIEREREREREGGREKERKREIETTIQIKKTKSSRETTIPILFFSFPVTSSA